MSSTLQNATANSRLEECTVVGRDSKVVNPKEKAVIIVNHDDFKTADGEPEELYALPRWFKIIEEDLPINILINLLEIWLISPLFPFGILLGVDGWNNEVFVNL